MSKRSITIAVALMLAFFLFDTAGAQIRDHSTAKQKSKATSNDKSGKNGLKPFATLIKDKVVIEGLFTFYRDTVDNSMLMAIKADQLGPYYLCNMAKGTADGSYYDTGPLGRSFPFYFKRVGKKIMMLEKNLRFRADSASTMSDAVAKGISDHLFASMDVKSLPKDSAGAVLINPSAIFIRDADNVSYYLGQRARLGVSFDSKNSFYETVKSFPENSEINVKLHFKANHNLGGVSLQNGRSFFHTYHYSLSSLPETDYEPRLADDRVAYFITQYQDYTNLDTRTPYIRYIDRWNLKKKNPDARISEPVKPIVYWIDNAVPVEFRDAIAEGVEFWNPAFEKIGFRNAIVAKQMPDTVDWDPLDVRYSTIRWMVSPGAGYAIGPHRANPFTGQIYDADISISVDLMRYFFNLVDEFVLPVSTDGRILDNTEIPERNEGMQEYNDRHCNYAEELAREAAFGLSYLLSTEGAFANKDSVTREYVHAVLVEFVAHEVGHTLGFRHNFKASSIYTLEQLRDRNFTRTHSTGGTVMDYNPPLISGKGQVQGEFFASVPGPYDDFMIEYGYSEFGDVSVEEETEHLKTIASRIAEPQLAYATDFDLNAFAVDPLAQQHDMGNDPIAYSEHQIGLTRELWQNAANRFEKSGESYEKIRLVFQNGWRAYRGAARIVPRVVGGLYHSKSYVGDPGGKVPFTPVPATEQRRAVKFICDNIFAADAFDVPAELLNKLQPARFGDFAGTIYRSPIAYQWHERVLNIQRRAVNTLYIPRTLARLLNNLSRVPDDQPKYTMHDLFTEVRRSIWSEIVAPNNVSSLRRQLQMFHLRRIIYIYLSNASVYPSDALTLAANDLEILKNAAQNAIRSKAINEMTRAHFKEVLRQINAALSADRNYFDL
ncbi:MAG: zinc-dependent metalloprotease [candidate division Zixibacteria bacterium]|nr:zinc-dependent metalloprotease [candidate division Zixibacteria bacterium]